MSRAALLLVVPVMLACSKKEEPAADTSAAMAAAPAAAAPAAAPMNVAGNWTVTVKPEKKDSVLLTYKLVTTNDKTGWKMTLPNRPEMEPRVTWMDNDSIVIENGPYSSVLRKSTMVTTHSTMHMEGDKLVGVTIAHYNTKGADTVAILRTEAVRQ
jgi:Zn-dependent protease with chaperone function